MIRNSPRIDKNFGRMSTGTKLRRFLVFLSVILALFAARHPIFGRAEEEEDAKCTPLLDFMMLVDMSGSVGWDNWKNSVVPAARAFLEALNIGPDEVHTAFAKYDHSYEQKWDLSNTNNYDKETCLRNFDDAVASYNEGGTATGRALELLHRNILHGPGRREDVPALILVMTDGKSGDDVVPIARKLQDEEVVVMVIGIAQANEIECRTIAGCEPTGDCKWFQETSWADLVKLIPSVLDTVCERLPKEDEVCSEWENEWGSCSVTCGEGIKEMKRKTPHVISPAKRNGLTCEQQGWEEKKQEICKPRECPSDAKCGEFGDWTCCSKTCGGGYMTRERIGWNDPPAENGGKTCEEQGLASHEEKECNTDPCAKDAVPGDWGEWSECSKSCGYGATTRVRGEDLAPAEHGGKTTEEQNVPTVEEKICQNFPCGPCTAQWASWTPCTRTCGAGYRSRHRIVRFDYPTHACPLKDYENQHCKLAECAAIIDKPESEEPADGGGTNAAAIAGGVVGGAALLGAAAAGAHYFTGGGKPGASAPRGDAYETTDQDAPMQEEDEVVNVDADSELWAAD